LVSVSFDYVEPEGSSLLALVDARHRGGAGSEDRLDSKEEL
jgi:hypothetical protein